MQQGGKALRRSVKIAAAVLVVLVAVGYSAVAYNIASSLTTIDRKPLEDSPAAHRLVFEDVSFAPHDAELTLSGWFIEGQGRGKAVVFVHGHNNNREENGDYLNISERLVAEGYSVLLFDLRGHGRSEGDRVSYGYYERNDLSAAIDFLASRGIPPERVGVLGFSMGAGTALLGAVQEPRVRALVADSTYARASDLVASEIDQQTDIPGWLAPVFVPGGTLLAELLFDVDVGELVPENAARDLDYPILVIHGEADTRIPPSHGERVHKAAHPASQLWLLPGIEHTDAFPTYPDQYMEWVTTYLESRLPGQ